jgi:hypothetical protein
MATNATIRNVPSSGMKPKKKNAFDARVFLESVSEHRERFRSSEKSKSSSLRATIYKHYGYTPCWEEVSVDRR